MIPESTNRGGEKMNQESLGNSIQHISASVYLRAKEAGKFTHRLPSVIGSGLFLGMLTPWDFWLPWRRLSTLLLPEKKAFRQSCDDCSKKPSTCKGIHTTFTDVKGIRGRHWPHLSQITKLKLVMDPRVRRENRRTGVVRVVPSKCGAHCENKKGQREKYQTK